MRGRLEALPLIGLLDLPHGPVGVASSTACPAGGPRAFCPAILSSAFDVAWQTAGLIKERELHKKCGAALCGCMLPLLFNKSFEAL